MSHPSITSRRRRQPRTMIMSKRPKFDLRLVITIALSSSCLIDGCKSYTIQPGSWQYKGHPVYYEEARQIIKQSQDVRSQDVLVPCVRRDDENDDEQPVLLLNGFGVGSFHQHRLMPNLLHLQDNDNVGDEQVVITEVESGKAKEVGLRGGGGGTKVVTKKNDNGGGKICNRVVYGVDYLGQGRSWPQDCDDGNSETEQGLIYSIDTWADQIIQFIEEVIVPNHKRIDGRPTKVHLVGNSVGGHLSVVIAAKRPDLIDSICLLNATPVWGLNLPGWNGQLPPPALPRKIGRYLFDRIRDLQTIEKYLEAAYHNRAAFDKELIQQIRSCTEGKGGHAAFASILWSPPATFPSENARNFHKNLSKLQCDVLLLFGKNDPWCRPAFAKKMLKFLDMRDQAHVHRYVELENVGHCPNHEAPQAVGQAVTRWINAKDRSKQSLRLVDGEKEIVREPWVDVVMREVDKNEIEVKLIDMIAATFV